MKLLALDQASKTSGYAIFEDSKLIEVGKFTFQDADIGDRLQKIRNKVYQLIQDNNIDQIIFEDIQLQSNVGNNVATFKVLAEVFGVLYELFTELEIPNEAVLAITWKSKLKIQGKQRAEQKKNTQLYVLNTYGRDVTQDEADAVAIGTYFLNKDIKEKTCAWS